MGHRANYALRTAAGLQLYYAAEGARALPLDVVWGPAFAEACARAQQPVDEWLDDVRGEGGLALDAEARVCVWFGAHELCHPPYREAFLTLMQGLWEGWSVRYAEGGLPDVAAAVGVEPASVTADTSRQVYTPRQAGERARREGVACFLLRVANAQGVAERVGGVDLCALLAGGPPLLDLLEDLPPLAELREQLAARDPEAEAQAELGQLDPALLEHLARAAGVSPQAFAAQVAAQGAQAAPPPLAEQLTQGAWIDPQARALRLVSRWPLLPADLQAVRQAWDGWALDHTRATLAPLYAASGDPLPADLAAELPPEPEPAPAPGPAEVQARIQELLLAAAGAPGRPDVEEARRLLASAR